MLFLRQTRAQERHFDCSSKNLSLILFPSEPKSHERGPWLFVMPDRIRQTSQKADALMVRNGLRRVQPCPGGLGLGKLSSMGIWSCCVWPCQRNRSKYLFNDSNFLAVTTNKLLSRAGIPLIPFVITPPLDTSLLLRWYCVLQPKIRRQQNHPTKNQIFNCPPIGRARPQTGVLGRWHI